MNDTIKTPETHPDHPVVGRYFAAYSVKFSKTQIYYCDSYDPAVDYFMTNILHPEDRRDVSVRAIGRTWHEAEDRGTHWFVPGWAKRIEKVGVVAKPPSRPETPMQSDINTNARLFDLVRYMRINLHETDLITDEEYAWLCSEAPLAKGSGSPSPRRLEDYDRIRTRMDGMEDALKKIVEMVGGESDDPDRDIARMQDLASEALEGLNVDKKVIGAAAQYATQYWRDEKGWCEASVFEELEKASNDFDRWEAEFPNAKHRLIVRATIERLIRETPSEQVETPPCATPT